MLPSRPVGGQLVLFSSEDKLHLGMRRSVRPPAGWDKGLSSDVKNPYIGAVAGTRPTVAKDGSDYASAVASFRDADGKAEPAL
jgi:hypothetical protein